MNSLAASGLTGVTALVVAAFSFEFLHVMTARFAGEGGALGAIASTALLILVHVGSAIVIAVGGFAVIMRTIGGAGRARPRGREQSAGGRRRPLAAVRAFRPRRRDGERRGLALVAAAGLCRAL